VTRLLRMWRNNYLCIESRTLLIISHERYNGRGHQAQQLVLGIRGLSNDGIVYCGCWHR
jgi:hypothetical protein